MANMLHNTQNPGGTWLQNKEGKTEKETKTGAWRQTSNKSDAKKI